MAVYSEADRHARHVQLADQAFCIGPPAAKDSYLRKDRVLQVSHHPLLSYTPRMLCTASICRTGFSLLTEGVAHVLGFCSHRTC